MAIASFGPGTFVFTDGAPTHNPTDPDSHGSKFAVDKNTFIWYEWVSGTTWKESGSRIQVVASAPTTAPGIHESRLQITTAGQLYFWNGTVWDLVNDPNTDAQTLALVGRALSISGGNSVTLPNDLQTLSIDGNDLTLSNGGGTVTLPGGGGDGNGIYSGSGSVPDGTVATLMGSFAVGSSDSSTIEGGSNGGGLLIYPNADGVSKDLFLISKKAGEAASSFLLAKGGFLFTAIDSTNGSNALYLSAPSVTQIYHSGQSRGTAYAATEGLGWEGGVIFGHEKIGADAGVIQVKYNEFIVQCFISGEGSYGVKRSDGDSGIEVLCPNGKGLYYSTITASDILAAEDSRTLASVEVVDKMLGSDVTVTGATSADANAAAITAGLSAGAPYRWDDGDGIHLMFVR